MYYVEGHVINKITQNDIENTWCQCLRFETESNFANIVKFDIAIRLSLSFNINNYFDGARNLTEFENQL